MPNLLIINLRVLDFMIRQVKEGVSFKKFYDTAKKAISKKQKERKPQMDSTTKKLHKWRTDKEQKEREKYVTFTKPVEDD